MKTLLNDKTKSAKRKASLYNDNNTKEQMMKRITFLLLSCVLLLTACSPASTSAPTPLPPIPSATASNTPTLSPSPSAAPSATPSETAVPLPAEISPEQMTTSFNLANPNIPKTDENMVTTGVLRQSVLDYLKTAAGGSLLNTDGSVNMANLPPGIKLAQPGQWTINSSVLGGEEIFIRQFLRHTSDEDMHNYRHDQNLHELV